MKKLITIGAALLMAVGLGLGSATAAVEAPKGPIKVTNYGKKDAVNFDHSKHTGQAELKDCKTCHHKAGDTADSYKCGGCHKLAEEGGAPAIKDAAHGKDVGKCYSCHRVKGGEHEKKCADCHKG